MAFRTPTIKPVDIKTFNEKLKYCKSNRVMVYNEKPNSERVSLRAYLVVKEVEIDLTFKEGNKVSTYRTRLDGETASVACGIIAWQQVNRFYKVPRAKFPGEIQHSSSGILWKNDKYENQRIKNCIGYDINSSYTWAMCQDMPDTSVKPRIGGIVGKNEIGFDCDKNLVFEGRYANLIFPKIESPFKKFAEVWYKKKKDAKTKEEKQYSKNILNASIGYFQRENPILRTAIIWYANNRIEKLIKKNPRDIIYCNTDSVISLRPIKEIEDDIGTELGQWKIEHDGDFAFKGFCYQWNLTIPSYRGVSKKWFPDGWDILKDQLPTNGNLYYFDETSFNIKEKK